MSIFTPKSKSTNEITWGNVTFTWANITFTWGNIAFWKTKTKH